MPPERDQHQHLRFFTADGLDADDDGGMDVDSGSNDGGDNDDPSLTLPSAFHVSILIFKGEPLDYQRYRHVALSFRPLATPMEGVEASTSASQSSLSSTTSTSTALASLQHALVVHVTGAPGEMALQAVDHYHPALDPEGRALVRDVAVGQLRKEVAKREVVRALGAAVAVDNADREFNCQTWVEKAMRRLREWGWVSDEEFEQGVDGMVDCILEAEEDPEG